MAGKKQNNILVQGSILAVASIIARLIGIAYRIPMSNMLGEEGNGIYSVAFNIYNTALIISSYSLPLAVSKLISARRVKKQYHNALQIFKNALRFAVAAGLVAGLVLFFGADFFETLYVREGLAKPLRILAPTLFVVALLGVFRGYFQGRNTMVPTAFSQVFEQIINGIVSVVATYGFMKAHSASMQISAYGAAGGTLGTLTGAVGGLFFVLFVFYINYPMIRRGARKDMTGNRETNAEQMKLLVLTILPVILSQTVYQLSTTVDDALFGNLMTQRGYTEKVVGAMQGVYNSQYILLVNLPLSIATAMAASSIPSIVGSYEMDRKGEVRKKTASLVKFNMVIAIPSAVGLAVLADPIMSLLFPSLVTYHDLAVGLTMTGSAAVIFFAFSTITSAVLQGLDHMRVPVIHNAVSLVIHIVLVFVLLKFTPLGTYALIVGNVTFPIVVCILNGHAMRKYISYHQEVIRSIFTPLFSSVIMGAAAYGTYHGMNYLVHSSAISLGGSIVVAVLVYGLCILLFRCFGAQELRSLPMGTKIYRIARKLHLM